MDKKVIFLFMFLFVGAIVLAANVDNVIDLKEYMNVKIIEPLESNGAVPVNIQDQHSEIIDLILHNQIDTIALNQTNSIDDRFIYINTSTTPDNTMIICLKEESAFYQASILSVSSIGGDMYLIELDTPLDYAFTSATYGELATTNMAIDGSSTPVIFKVSPKGSRDNVSWDITRIIFVMAGTGIGAQNDAPDDGDFGVTGVLTNGVVLRSINGITKNIFNVKRNGEFRLRAYDVEYTDASKAGLYSVGVRRTFAGQSKNGVTVRLDAITNDTIEVIIQDDLTDMFGMKAVVQGHMVTD